MSKPKSNFVRGADIKTVLTLGKIRIAEAWMDHYGLTYDKTSVKRSKGPSGQAIIELKVDSDINKTILNGNPDWKSGKTGSARIIFEFED